MSVIYKTNGALTTRILTEWYFGKKFISEKTAEAERISSETGKYSFEFWQNGTGRLTIEIH